MKIKQKRLTSFYKDLEKKEAYMKKLMELKVEANNEKAPPIRG